MVRCPLIIRLKFEPILRPIYVHPTPLKKLDDLLEKIDQLQAEMEELKARLSEQDQKIIFLENEISSAGHLETPGNLKSTASCTKNVDNKAFKANQKPSPRALTSLPTSCDGLRREGHFADGIYLMFKEKTKKIDAVLCQFQGANKGKMKITLG